MESYSNSSARVPESSRNREDRLQRNFHAEIAALEMQKCTTCSEAFPGLQLRSHSTECMRCNRDKHVPKLYSSMNNMPRRTSRAAPAAPHHPLCTRLRIHRIRAHARPHNAVHSPSVLSMLHYTYFIDVTCVKLDKFRICGTTYDT